LSILFKNTIVTQAHQKFKTTLVFVTLASLNSAFKVFALAEKLIILVASTFKNKAKHVKYAI